MYATGIREPWPESMSVAPSGLMEEAIATFRAPGASQFARQLQIIEGVMHSRNRLAGALALWVSFASCVFAADTPVAKLKDEMRQPWERGDTSFIRSWKIAGAFR